MNRDNVPFDTSMLRVPPQSLEAEASLLGGILLDNEALNRFPPLTPEAFYRHEHQEIFRAINQLASAGKSFDLVTVFEHMRTAKGGAANVSLLDLSALAQYVPSAANIRRYADIVREKSILRQLVAAGDEISTKAFTSDDSAAAIDAAQMLLAKLATVKARKEPRHISESLVEYIDLLNDLSEGKNPALATGIVGLDRLLNGGLRRGELMVIGARPKHGKTAVALGLARSLAHRYTVLFLSQEMPVMQLMHRHTAAMGSIDLGRIMRADPKDSGMWSAVTEAAERLGQLALVHDDQSALSLLDIRRKVMKVKREHGLDVVFVDFLQLMQGAGNEESRNRELDVIANGLKAMALDLDICVVALSQMSRKADEHYSRPTMTYLRDSGAIEAAADQIALLFTDWAHPMSKRESNFKGFSELEIVAHRNGPQGLVPLQFIGEYQQVSDWDGAIPTRLATRTTRGMD